MEQKKPPIIDTNIYEISYSEDDEVVSEKDEDPECVPQNTPQKAHSKSPSKKEIPKVVSPKKSPKTVPSKSDKGKGKAVTSYEKPLPKTKKHTAQNLSV